MPRARLPFALFQNQNKCVHNNPRSKITFSERQAQDPFFNSLVSEIGEFGTSQLLISVI